MAKILVIDDDARNLKLAVTVLEQVGHEVLSTDSGSDGIHSARLNKPDLVLMDVQMPGMDGITALKSLRSEPRTAGLTVVALTALAMKGDAERLLAAGFDGYIQKPIQYKQFIVQVSEILERNAAPGGARE